MNDTFALIECSLSGVDYHRWWDTQNALAFYTFRQQRCKNFSCKFSHPGMIPHTHTIPFMLAFMPNAPPGGISTTLFFILQMQSCCTTWITKTVINKLQFALNFSLTSTEISKTVLILLGFFDFHSKNRIRIYILCANMMQIENYKHFQQVCQNKGSFALGDIK